MKISDPLKYMLISVLLCIIIGIIAITTGVYKLCLFAPPVAIAYGVYILSLMRDGK